MVGEQSMKQNHTKCEVVENRQLLFYSCCALSKAQTLPPYKHNNQDEPLKYNNSQSRSGVNRTQRKPKIMDAATFCRFADDLAGEHPNLKRRKIYVIPLVRRPSSSPNASKKKSMKKRKSKSKVKRGKASKRDPPTPHPHNPVF